MYSSCCKKIEPRQNAAAPYSENIVRAHVEGSRDDVDDDEIAMDFAAINNMSKKNQKKTLEKEILPLRLMPFPKSRPIYSASIHCRCM